MRKKEKKRKFNFIKLSLILIILYILSFGLYKVVNVPIKHIRILNTVNLEDHYILKQAKLDKYPSFFLTSSSSIKKNLSNNPYIKDVEVRKKWFYNLYLYIDEYKVLFFNRTLGQVVLENGVSIKEGESDVPHLINYVPDIIYNDFIKKMGLVDNDILHKISEIEYRPNDVDKQRFLLIMNDGNYVYLTLYNFLMINKYDDILPTLENKKGILYLDSGNYFEIID